MSDDLELESGPRARTESRVPLAAREPAQIRRRDTSSPPDVRVVSPRVPDPTSPIVSYNSDDNDQDMLSNAEGMSDPKAYIAHSCFCFHLGISQLTVSANIRADKIKQT